MTTNTELDARSSIRWLWRQLTSMRTALILLLLLGVAAIPGSLFPQRSQNPLKVSDYFKSNPGTAKFLDQLHIFDVYSSPWFSSIYILLFISLIGCVLPRSFEHLKGIGAQPSLTPKNLNRMEFHTEIANGNLDSAEAWLKKHRFRIRRDSNSISAEKGFMRETGNLLFHLSLILVLVGVALGSLYGMKGDAIINVGERFINTPTSYDVISYGKLQSGKNLSPFSITATDFKATYELGTGAPSDYKLTVNIANPVGTKEESRIVKVNSPLTFGATKVYLQANGYSPLVTVRDKNNNIKYQGAVIFLPQDGNLTSSGAIKVPDMQPQVGFVGSFVPTYSRSSERGAFSTYPEVLDPRLLISIWTGDLGLDSGSPQSIYRLNTSEMKRIGLKTLKLRETHDFGDGSITFEGWTPWVNLQIVKDPGKMYALLGSIFAILGLLMSLFTRSRRIWVKENQDKSGIEIAGLAKNSAPGLENEIASLVNKMKG
jgi:cytochrome c biogenesis protein